MKQWGENYSFSKMSSQHSMEVDDLLLCTVKLALRKLTHYSRKSFSRESCVWCVLTRQGDFSESLVAVFHFPPSGKEFRTVLASSPLLLSLWPNWTCTKLDRERSLTDFKCLLRSSMLLYPSLTPGTFLYWPKRWQHFRLMLTFLSEGTGGLHWPFSRPQWGGVSSCSSEHQHAEQCSGKQCFISQGRIESSKTASRLVPAQS